MTIRGRPVRFVALVVGGWTVLRLSTLLPIAPVPASDAMLPGENAPPGRPRISPVPLARTASSPVAAQPAAIVAFPPLPIRRIIIAATMAEVPVRASTAVAMAAPPAAAFPSVTSASPTGTGLAATENGLPARPSSDRWSGSAWALWRRDDSGAGYALGPRLGASQAGVRLDYALAPASPLRPALYARASSALEGNAAAEVAAGLAIRPPLPLPVTLAVERRQRVSRGGRNAFALLAAGGIYPVAIGHGFRLDAYAQAGVVGVRSRDAFADGRVTVERPVAGVPGLAFGAAVWGGVQPGVSRLDIGPQLSMRLRVADLTLRLGAEWRQEVAGNATPRSGPALSIGTDF